MKNNKEKIKKRLLIIFILVLTFKSTSVVCFSQEQINSRPEDKSKDLLIQKSLKKAIEENNKLQAEKEKMEEDLLKAKRQTTLFAERIRRLDGKVKSLQQVVKQKDKVAGEDKNKLESQISELQEKNVELLEEITKVEKKWSSQDYYRKWKQEKDNSKRAQAKLKKISKNLEKHKQENAKMHYNLGNLYFEQGKHRQAIYEYKQALELLPGDPDIYYNLAVLYDYYVPDTKEAAKYYRLFIRRKPQAKNAAAVKERIIDNEYRDKVAKKWED